MTNHALFDHFVFAFLLVFPIIEWKWSWPRYLRRLAADPDSARRDYYRRLFLGEWIPTLALLAYWAIRHRPWSDLALAGDPPLRLVLGLLYVLLLIAMLWWQRTALLSRPTRRARVRMALSQAEPLLPHNEHERHLFWIVCATAGACEEIFFRGFLTWYLALWIGPIWAVVGASALFGIGHVYMGISQVPKTAFIGFIFALVVALTGSLFPAMLLHAALDWNSGELAFRLFHQTEPEAGS